MTERFENVDDALSDSPEEAVNLKLRAEFIREIRHKIEYSGWTQSTTAEKLNESQPPDSEMLNRKISKFSLDSLVNMMATLGGEISLEVA